MAKGASIRFQSYSLTVPKLLDILKLDRELKKYDKIVIKPFLDIEEDKAACKEFIEPIIKFCLKHKNPVTELFIAEGADGRDTTELFETHGYKKLAEQYSIGLIDLNDAETELIGNNNFLKFSEIHYPRILKESFVITAAKLADHPETGIAGTLSTMLSAFPADHYSGFFTKKKMKIRRWPIKYAIHDINTCKMPDFAIVDASFQGAILAGLPLEIDKQSAKLLNYDWKTIDYLRLLHETSLSDKKENESI